MSLSEQTLSGTEAAAPVPGRAADDAIPAYLSRTYTWAYLTPTALKVFDHPPVVSAILWGNYHRLIRSALAEIETGQSVLQAACVYGDFSVRLAEAVGRAGRLDIIDVAAIQADNCRRKLTALPQARVLVCNAATPPPGPYDRVVSFFLLHEVPDDWKRRIVAALLDRVGPGGRVVFVDYHGPSRWHPLRLVMRTVNRLLEPFAEALWTNEIRAYAPEGDDRFSWRTETLFGGLYQKTVAVRRG